MQQATPPKTENDVRIAASKRIASSAEGIEAGCRSPGMVDLAKSLRKELTAAYLPESPVEIDLVESLSLTEAQWMEFETARQIKIAQERSTATLRFERLAADAFDRDKADWEADPESRTSIFARTYRGAAHLAAIWVRVLRELKAGDDIPFDLVRQTVLAMGSRWQVDKADEHAMTVVASFMKIAADQARAAETWARESKACDGLEFARIRAEKAVARTPGVEECRRGLIRIANQEAEDWKKLADRLKADFEAARAVARECAVGLGTGDRVLEKELRSLNRLATTARNRADRLMDKLARRIRERQSQAPRDAREIRPEPLAKSDVRPQENTAQNESKPGIADAKSPEKKCAGVSKESVLGMKPDDERDTAAYRGGEARDATRCDGLLTVAAHSGASVEPAGRPQSRSKGPESGTIRLSDTERKVLRVLRKMPDSPRRRKEIARLFGSDQKFREMCAAMDS